MYARRAAPGDGARASALIDAAIEQFGAIGMTGWIRQAEEVRRWCDQAPHDNGRAAIAPGSLPAAATAVAPTAVFRRDGDYWTIVYDAAEIRLKDSKGLRYLAHLLRNAGDEIPAIDLVQQAENGRHRAEAAALTKEVRPRADTPIPALDDRARAAYRGRLHELQDELREAEGCNDLGRCEHARAEIDALTEHLRGALGLGGRARLIDSDLERARSAVGKRLRSEIQHIRRAHPALGRHLAATVTTGYCCAYDPARDVVVRWEL